MLADDAGALVDGLDVDEHGLGEDAADAEVDGAAAEVAPDLGDAGGVGDRQAGQRDRLAVAQGVAEVEAVVGAGDRDELLEAEVSAQEPVGAAEDRARELGRRRWR